MAEPTSDPRPPAGADMRFRFRLTRWQWFGVPLFLLVPVLASFGLLGELSTAVDASSADLHVAVEYPRTHRYKLVRSMEMVVTNATAARLDTVTIDLAAGYADGFATSIAIPTFDRAWAIDLIGLEPAESRRVRIDYEWIDYGSRTGDLTVTSGGRDTIRIPLRTFIFP